ncbi:MAG: N-acetylneuraminate synthase [Planctomycetes bacterium]|nr:N-acetylneuraminate synthase [Planctomycetota bacterium]
MGNGRPCFIIAEAGVNHNGDVDLAERLVDAARDAGADAVKFQTWITERLVAPDARMAEYQRENLGGAYRTQFELLKELELGQEAFRRLREHADRQGILFFSTPDEEESADFLDGLGVPLFKLGSAEVTNLPFLRHVARKGKPILLSTGMATLVEVDAAVRAIEEAGHVPLVLLHCVSCYPTRPEDCNLRAMDTLASAFGRPVGFSDHTMGSEVAVAAVARGACVLEKHLTLDVSMPGPDHRASADPREFAAMVRAIRLVEAALGDGVKKPVAAELETRGVVRKAIVALRALQVGERIAEADVGLRRTSGGLDPSQMPLVVGRVVARAVPAGSPITLDVLAVL